MCHTAEILHTLNKRELFTKKSKEKTVQIPRQTNAAIIFRLQSTCLILLHRSGYLTCWQLVYVIYIPILYLLSIFTIFFISILDLTPLCAVYLLCFVSFASSGCQQHNKRPIQNTTNWFKMMAKSASDYICT